jgi:cellulose synthase/poly-beta-1,6-N-acetylglucosamine synthase-like glycosyltransferase
VGSKIAETQLPFRRRRKIAFAVFHLFLFNDTSTPFALIYNRLKTTITIIYCGLILHMFILQSVNHLPAHQPLAPGTTVAKYKTTDLDKYSAIF